MAEFSKQWCEINDPEMPWDFDILEVAEELEPEYGLNYICEGFGFTLIAKDEKGNIVLGFPDHITSKLDYKTYKEVIDGSI
jgi:hypothetical protein